MIRGLEVAIRRLERLLERYREPLAEAECELYVYPVPEVAILNPPAGAYLRGQVMVEVEISGELGGILRLCVDGIEVEEETVGVGKSVLEVDSRGYADGVYTSW